jgi:hypothetical protein
LKQNEWEDAVTFRPLLGALFAVFISASAHAQAPQLVTEELMVKFPDPGIEIYGATSGRPT